MKRILKYISAGAILASAVSCNMDLVPNNAITYQPGQQIIVDTGYLAAMDATCSMDIKTVPGLKNMVFGGEGIFNTLITGPGRVWLQTMPISGVAGEILKFMPASK